MYGDTINIPPTKTAKLGRHLSRLNTNYQKEKKEKELKKSKNKHTQCIKVFFIHVLFIIASQLNPKVTNNSNLNIKTIQLCKHIIKEIDQVCVCKASNKELIHFILMQCLRKDNIIIKFTILPLYLNMSVIQPKIKGRFQACNGKLRVKV